MKQLTEPQKAWISALRSGEYKQGRTTLHRGTGEMCCLGIACALASQNGVQLKTSHEDGNIVYNGRIALPPPEVVQWIGLNDKFGSLNDARLGDDYSLAAANDSGATFSEIADFIEAHPEAVFA